MGQHGRAAVIRKLDGQFHAEPVEFDSPTGREVLVQVEAAGLCHSDLNVATIDRGRSLPLIPGHELAGTVKAVGDAVTSLQVGDRVVGTEVRSCRECIQCVQGRATLCLRAAELERSQADPPKVRGESGPIQTLGVSAFASHSLADERLFVPIPQTIPAPEASLLGCAVSTGVGAVLNVARISPGESVAVFGLGGVGLNIVAGAALAGAGRIVAIDVNDAKLNLSRNIGATHVINSSEADVLTELRRIQESGADHVFDAVGLSTVTQSAIRSTARGGSAYLIGIPPSGSTLDLDTMGELIGHQRTIRGVYMGETNPSRDIPLYADLFFQGRLPLSELISEHISLDEIEAAYENTGKGPGARAVITNFC